jgi:membrane protein implicated in regulation of membrane protease activity
MFMLEWFEALEPMLRIYWSIALIASLVFVIQMIISFVGGDVFGDADLGGDGDAGSGSHFFSVRNLINFLLGAGWAGVSLYGMIDSPIALMFVAILIGFVFVLMFFGLMKILLKLQKDNTFSITETLGKTASVYLAIPENKSGNGKIQISVRGSYREIDAITAGERIATGMKVRVVEIVSNQVVLVEKI